MPTTSDFWSQGVNDADIVGGPARILISERSVTSYPELISDVLDLSTYTPQANWFDLGHSSEPFNISSGFEPTDWLSQQQGIINTQVGNWNRTVSVTLMETRNNKLMDAVHESGGRTTNADGDQVEYMWDKTAVTEWRLVAINLYETRAAGSNIIMDVFPRTKRSGADSEVAWSRNDAQVHSVEFRPFPDTGVPNDANWYRITQL